jgi:rare lipoprotein A
MTVILPMAGFGAVSVNPVPTGVSQKGFASWYAEFSPGINRTTANMEIFDHDKMTCAMWKVPFGSMVKVTNLENGKKIIVRVNDRGPAKRYYRSGRIIDLTKSAFEKIAPREKGLVRVQIEILR